MREMPRHHKTSRLGATAVGLALVVLAWWQITEPGRDLTIRRDRLEEAEGLPVTYVVHPDSASPGGRPGVLIAHGFGSTRKIMLGYAYTLAYAGYGVVLWDFGGHGANAGALDASRNVLQDDVDAALAYLRRQQEVDPNRLAIVGHSMGSGAAMAAGIRLPETFDAVVALSPTSADVTETLPRNLLLQAGTWEPRFLENGRNLLDRAGGPGSSAQDFADGTARALLEVPRREHITILFDRRSQHTLLRWLEAVFGRSGPVGPDWATTRGEYGAGIGPYRDRRGVFYGLHVMGWMLLALAAAPFIRRARPAAPRSHGAGGAGSGDDARNGDDARGAGDFPGAVAGRNRIGARRRRLWWVWMVAGPFAATGILALLSGSLPITRLGGMLVGGAVALWFGLFGAIWLAGGTRPRLPAGRSVLLGVGLFAFLWVGVGVMTQEVALQWLLIPYRLARWPAFALLSLPWLLAAGVCQAGTTRAGRAAMYLAQTVTIVAALGLAGVTVSNLFIVVLVLPVLPAVFLILSLAAAILDDPWAYALGAAPFFGWMLVAVFPLTG